MSLQITQGTTGYVNPAVGAVQTGWSISDGVLNHVACNSGFAESLTDYGLDLTRDYTFTYTVQSYSSGYVALWAGTREGTHNNANGTYTQTLQPRDLAKIYFFSDGNLQVSALSFYDTLLGPQAAQIVSFHDRENKWTADYEYEPDAVAKFIDSYISWKDGELWLHNTNPVQGNIYGVQYSPKITLIVNAEYQKEKIFYNFRMDAVGNWYMPSITTPESNQFPNGMASELKKNNFKLRDNKLWADILSDMNDPNFAGISDPTQRRLQALFNGRRMQGGWLIVNLQCNDTTYSEISSIETYFVNTERSI